METLHYEYPAAQAASKRALAGVVGSGDLEVLLEPHADGHTRITIHTSVEGMGKVWQALMSRLFSAGDLPACQIEINDFGATPGVVRLRIEQALESLCHQGTEI
jgi:malonate decarboxylase delta subunit